MTQDTATYQGDGFEIASNSGTSADLAKSFETPAETPKTAPESTEDGGNEEVVSSGAPTTPEGRPEGKKHKPIQPRIDQLTREARTAERERDEYRAKADEIERRAQAYEAELAKLRPAKETRSESAAPAGKPRPELADFETLEDHAEAVADWKYDQRKLAESAAVEAEKAQAKEAETQRKIIERVETFRDGYVKAVTADPGIGQSEVVSWVPIINLEDPSKATAPNFIAQQFLDREKGLDILKYFASNPDDARRIAALPRPMDIMVELAIIEKGLVTANPTASVTGSEVSNAAPPARPVTGGPTIRNGPSEADDDETYFRKRQAQELKKRSR